MGTVRTFNVGAEPEILIRRVNGDLAISGWDRSEIQVRADGRTDDGAIGQHGETITIATDGDCAIQAPLRSRLRIQSADGDASITMLLNSIEIDGVGGDLSVASVGPTTINSVAGSLSVRAVAGSLLVNNVDGDAQVSQIAGGARLNAVAGDLAVNEVVGNVFATADGDAKLTLQLAPGQTVTVAASGDIVCQVQTDACANVRLTADGDIRVKNLGELRKASNTSLEFVLGGDPSGDHSGAALQLTADGDIALRGIAVRPPEAEFGFGDEFDAEMNRRAAAMGAQITREVETQVEVLTRDLEEKFNRMAENEEFSSRIQDKVAAAMRRAEEKMAEAMRKLEVRTQEGDSRRRKGYGWQAPPPAPPPPPAAPRKPQATDEERMMILRMVEQGKLSVDQAEKLLAAIAGRKVER
jgi:hypothetical protein